MIILDCEINCCLRAKEIGKQRKLFPKLTMNGKPAYTELVITWSLA